MILPLNYEKKVHFVQFFLKKMSFFSKKMKKLDILEKKFIFSNKQRILLEFFRRNSEFSKEAEENRKEKTVFFPLSLRFLFSTENSRENM